MCLDIDTVHPVLQPAAVYEDSEANGEGLTSDTEGQSETVTEKKQIPLTEPRQTTSRATSRATPLFGSNSASDDDNGDGRNSSSSEEDRGGKAHGRTLTRLAQLRRIHKCPRDHPYH